MYAGILGEIANQAAPTTEADPVGIYASLQAGTGALIGSGPHVQIGNVRHPLLIWVLLLGRTGSGRKGEATATAEIFLREAKPEDYMGIAVTGLSSGEGLIQRISDDHDENDKRLLVFEPEFSAVMARSRREGSTLAAVQRQAWDGRALTVMNRKQLRASSSHVAIIGHISPKEFRLRLADSDMTGGTYNRYLPFFVERSQILPIPEGVSEHVKRQLSRRLTDCIDEARKHGRIQLGQRASHLWKQEIYPDLTAADDDDRAEAEFTRRAAPYALRIAGLHALLDGRTQIGERDLLAASAQVRYAIASGRYVLDRQIRDPRLDRIRRAIDTAGDAGLTRTQVSALFSRNLPKDSLDELLDQLTSFAEYEQTRLPTRGRPAETYRRTLVSSSFVPIDPPTPSSPSEDDPLFEKFWAAYPRKIARTKARAAWSAAIERGADPAAIIPAAERFATECTGRDPKYIPHPTSWLNDERWLDQPAFRQAASEGIQVTCPVHQIRHLEGTECRGCAADRKAGQL